MTVARILSRMAVSAALAGLWLSPVAASAATSAKPKRTVQITIPLAYTADRSPVWSIGDEAAEQYRWRRYRHRGGIDGGDVVIGLLVLGGVAAVASAIDKDGKQRRDDRTEGRSYPRDERDGGYDYRDEDRDSEDAGRRSPNEMRAAEADRAVEACTREAERSGRVDEVFDVDDRDGEWRVRGDYENGREFTCTVDGSGRAYIGMGRDDEADWDRRSDAGDAVTGSEREVEVAVATRGGNGDDRYATAQAPDFEDPRGR